MRKTWTFGLTVLIGFGSFLGVTVWKKGEPRRSALLCIEHLQHSLATSDHECLNYLALPNSVKNLTEAEQLEFVRKALHDELTPAGIGLLKEKGRFGSLKQLFPDEAQKWAAQAGVGIEDCIAFKMQQNGLQTEAVLCRSGEVYRIVRCTNVKRLALQTPRKQ